MSLAHDGQPCADEVKALHVAVLPAAADAAEVPAPLCRWSKPGGMQTAPPDVPAAELAQEQLMLGVGQSPGGDDSFASSPSCAEADLQTFLSDWQDQLTEGKRELAKSLTSLKRHGSACGTSQTTAQQRLDELGVLTKSLCEELPDLALDPACLKGLVAHIEVVKELVNGLSGSSNTRWPLAETAVAAQGEPLFEPRETTGDVVDDRSALPVQPPCDCAPEAKCKLVERSPCDECPQFGFMEESVKLASQASGGACSTCSYPACTSYHSSTPNSRPSSPSVLQPRVLRSALSAEDLASSPLTRGVSTAPAVDPIDRGARVQRRMLSPLRQVPPGCNNGIVVRRVAEGCPDLVRGSVSKAPSRLILPPPQVVKDQSNNSPSPKRKPLKVVKPSDMFRGQSPPARSSAAGAGIRYGSPVRGTPAATRSTLSPSVPLPSALHCVSPAPQSGCSGGTPAVRKYIATAVPLQRKAVTEALTEPCGCRTVLSENRQTSPTRGRVTVVRKLP
mmetsp:Transcript_10205/g.22458  ORF Transcript_10205/g.22458 Transcript_10205/m.22458 type:complete len:505 (+) Transcript_10205:39-1553(+)